MLRNWQIWIGAALLSANIAHAEVTLLAEEPYGKLGAMTATGHAAVYLSRVCAETPVLLRRCQPGETGVVLSRYHHVGNYDWVAIPLLAYLYAVDRPDQVPTEIGPEAVIEMRDEYRRVHLESIIPDLPDGGMPSGDWTQLVGESYLRSIYTFSIETSEAKDDELIAILNSRPNAQQFHLLSRNCADFSREIIDFYYPKSVHRDLLADLGITTPKQDAQSLVSYSKKHRDVQLAVFVIPQVPGSIPRSSTLRGVLDSFVHTKKFAVPLVPLAVIHPVVGGGMVYAWFEGRRFQPSHDGGAPTKPDEVVADLR